MRRDRQGLLLAFFLCLTVAVTPGRAADDKDQNLTPNAHFMSGKLYFNQKVYDKAEEQFAAAVQGDTTSAEYRSFWATSMCELALSRLDATARIGDPKERLQAIQDVGPLLDRAGHEFDNAIAMDPKKQADFASDNRLHYWVDLYKQATTLQNDKRYEDALEIFKLSTVLDPGEPGGHFQVAFTYALLGEIRKAVGLAEESREMARVRIAEMGDCSQFRSSRKKAECRRRIENMEKTIKNVDGFTRKFNFDLGNEAFERASQETDPVKQQAILDEAIGFYTEALEQDPRLIIAKMNMGKAWFEKGGSLRKSGNEDASTRAYQEAGAVLLAVADDDSVDVEKQKEALYTAAQAQMSARDWPKASELLKRYVDMNPRDPEPYALNATCQLNGGQRLEGVAYFMMANALSDKAEATPVSESVTTARNLYSGMEMGQALAELGEPDQVRTFVDKDQEGREITSWIWWSKGKAQHFIKGSSAGVITFRPMTNP